MEGPETLGNASSPAVASRTSSVFLYLSSHEKSARFWSCEEYVYIQMSERGSNNNAKVRLGRNEKELMTDTQSKM
jgi:hypothetical protein